MERGEECGMRGLKWGRGRVRKGKERGGCLLWLSVKKKEEEAHFVLSQRGRGRKRSLEKKERVKQDVFMREEVRPGEFVSNLLD